MSLRRRVGVFAFLAIFFPFTAMAMPANFSKIYVFGDSLSDGGNVYALSSGGVPPSTRYHSGRFSNGRVWIDFVARAMGISASRFVYSLSPQVNAANLAAGYSINYSYGGATTGVGNYTPGGELPVKGLLGQVEDFRALAASAGGTRDAAHSLYVVWGGANDYLLANNSLAGIGPANPPATVANVKNAIQELYDLGARKFLVPTLPDLGIVPVVVLGGPEAQTYYTALSQEHNSRLRQALLDLKSRNPNIVFYNSDVFGLYRQILAHPRIYGFRHSLKELGPAWGCLILPPHDCTALSTGLAGEGYPTWDEEHPTTVMQRLIAWKAFATKKL